MEAQPIPARANTGYMITAGVSGETSVPTAKAVASMRTPARMVFFLPSLEEIIPTGM